MIDLMARLGKKSKKFQKKPAKQSTVIRLLGLRSVLVNDPKNKK